MKYYVFFNGVCVGILKSLKCAHDFCTRKGLKDDANNALYITDENGDIF